MWTRRIIVGDQIKDDYGEMPADEYRTILGDRAAQVEVLVGHTVGYGDAKVHVTVRLTCNQDDATIWRAGELAYTRAKELTESALNDLIPPTNPKGTS
jgi:hypothetical protein